jgi:hypothetical protein
MVGDNTVRSINAVSIFLAKLALVRSDTCELLYSLEDASKDIGIIVRALALNRTYDTLETHAGVNVLRRKWSERTVVFTVELHEDVVPDLDNQRIIIVHKMSGVPATNEVIVYFTIGVLSMVQQETELNSHLQGPQGPVAPISIASAMSRPYIQRHKIDNSPQKLSLAFPGIM